MPAPITHFGYVGATSASSHHPYRPPGVVLDAAGASRCGHAATPRMYQAPCPGTRLPLPPHTLQPRHSVVHDDGRAYSLSVHSTSTTALPPSTVLPSSSLLYAFMTIKPSATDLNTATHFHPHHYMISTMTDERWACPLIPAPGRLSGLHWPVGAHSPCEPASRLVALSAMASPTNLRYCMCSREDSEDGLRRPPPASVLPVTRCL